MQQHQIFISPLGDDCATGTIQAPVKTLQKAKEIVRTIPKGNITVFLRGGIYPVNETVVFNLADGGNDEKIVTYTAYEDETPCFWSGAVISQWEKVEEEICDLPECAVGKIYKAPFPKSASKILTLFSDSDCLTRCHSEMTLPTKNIEYERADSLNVVNEKDRPLLRRVDFPKGLIKQRDNMQDVELRFMPVPWTMNLLPIASVDEENGVATLAVEATTPLCAKPDGMRVENDIMYLQKEGWFCANQKTRTLYYFGDPTGQEIWTPTVIEYIRVEGEIDVQGAIDIPVCNLHFKGIAFRGGMRDTTIDGYKGSGIQHDWEMYDKSNAMIRFRGAQDCSLSHCRIYDTSSTALRLDLHCQNILIENNLFDNIGNMGILLCGYGPGTKDVNHSNIIHNNIITRCGTEIWHGHAIFVWQSGKNKITHNRIHHTARKGIGICGVRITILRHPEHLFDEAVKTIRWAEINASFPHAEDVYDNYQPYLHSRNNLIAYNEVFKALEKIGDGAVLNVSGAGAGNIMQNNYVHHISTYLATSVMRTDDWQRDTLFENNIIYKANVSAITRKGFNHLVNNIMVDANCKNGYLRFASYPYEQAHFGSLICKNVCYDTGDEMQVLGKGYLISDGATYPENCKNSDNIYFCKNNEKPQQSDFMPKNAQEFKCLDPMFEDIANENFKFKNGSPALKMGIKSLDVTEMGLTDKYPQKYKKIEYVQDLSVDTYERGKNPDKQNYGWW